MQSFKIGNFSFSEGEQTSFMRIQSEKNFEPLKFTDVFSAAKNSRPEEFIFFVSRSDTYGYMSNWLGGIGHLGRNNIFFPTAEHELMYRKAEIFNDKNSMLKIREASTPDEAKKIGRQVSSFDEKTWKMYRYDAVYQTVLNKFKQSKELLKLLLSTGDRYIVEAADYDTIFGIGLLEFSSSGSRGCKLKNGEFDILPEDWVGQNMLGIALMEVRFNLRNYNESESPP